MSRISDIQSGLVRYKVNSDGSISTISPPEYNGGSGDQRLGYAAAAPSVDRYYQQTSGGNVFRTMGEAQNAQASIRNQKNIEDSISSVRSEAAAQAASARSYADSQISALRSQYEDQLSRDRQYTALAEQIRALAGAPGGGGQQYNQAVAALGAGRNLGTGDMASALNFQISDEQILNDINAGQQNRLRSAIDSGQGRVAFLTDRIAALNNLLNAIPEGDPRRVSSDQIVKELQKDLSSTQAGILKNQQSLSDFKPIEYGSSEGNKLVSDFRESLRLPEERALQQIRQIDPEMYASAKALSSRYLGLAAEPLPRTTTRTTEALRKTVEQEALNQLQLGSQIGAEERRGYEQAVRAAQTARGNIAGLGPAVQEAATLGLAGEQRKLARYGAAQQLLSSGQTTESALKSDIAFRDALQRSRLGEAAQFLATGPSPYMLAQARTAQQQAQFQNYINANQAQPGQFGMQAYQTPGYMFVNPEIPSQLTGQQGSMFSNLYGQQAGFASDIYGKQAGIYGSQLQYQGQTYGDQVRAQASRPTFAQQFAGIAGGFGDITKGLGGLASAGILCWVAREVYGEDNPRWLMFRNWMLNKAPKWFLKLYVKFGERFASIIRNMPNVKRVIRIWMDSKIKECYGA